MSPQSAPEQPESPELSSTDSASSTNCTDETVSNDIRRYSTVERFFRCIDAVSILFLSWTDLSFTFCFSLVLSLVLSCPALFSAVSCHCIRRLIFFFPTCSIPPLSTPSNLTSSPSTAKKQLLPLPTQSRSSKQQLYPKQKLPKLGNCAEGIGGRDGEYMVEKNICRINLSS